MTFRTSDVLLKKDVLKGKITEQEKQEIEQRITKIHDIAEFSGVDFAIEVRSANARVSASIPVPSLTPHQGNQRKLVIETRATNQS